MENKFLPWLLGAIILVSAITGIGTYLDSKKQHVTYTVTPPAAATQAKPNNNH